jgi:hypothetical protein
MERGMSGSCQEENRAAFVVVLERRLPELTPAQTARVRRVMKSADSHAARG